MANSIIRTTLIAETSKYNKGLNDAKKSLNSFGQSANKLGSTLGVNVSALTKMGTAVGAASTAFKVLKDAFMANENVADEWGRTIKSSQSVYSAFLNSLNNSNFSGFLNSIKEVIDASREFYDALDELGTYQAFNQVNNARNRAGYSTALENYKENPTAENKDALKKANDEVVKELAAEQKKTQDSYIKGLKSLAKEGGLKGENAKKFVSLFSTGGYDQFTALKGEYSDGLLKPTYFRGKKIDSGNKTLSWAGHGPNNPSTPLSQQDAQDFYFAQALSHLNDDKIKSVQELGAKAQQLQQAQADQNRQFNRLAGNNGKTSPNGTTGKGGGNTPPPAVEGSIDWYNQEISKLSKTLNATTDAEVRVNVQKLIDEYSKAMDLLKDRAKNYRWVETNEAFKNTDAYKNNNSYWSSYQANETIASSWTPGKDYSKLRIDSTKLKEATDEATRLFLLGNKVENSWAEAAQAIGGLGSALAGIEDPAAKVLGIIAQAIANVALSMAQALTKKESQMGGVWGWIAAAAAGTATMISTISAIKSATSYHAEGGIVGTSALARGTDTVPAMLTPGEIVLNRAQQGVLANRLQNSAFGQMQLSATIKGEDIRLALNNGSRRKGKGEYVTSK